MELHADAENKPQLGNSFQVRELDGQEKSWLKKHSTGELFTLGVDKSAEINPETCMAWKMNQQVKRRRAKTSKRKSTTFLDTMILDRSAQQEKLQRFLFFFSFLEFRKQFHGETYVAYANNVCLLALGGRS